MMPNHKEEFIPNYTPLYVIEPAAEKSGYAAYPIVGFSVSHDESGYLDKVEPMYMNHNGHIETIEAWCGFSYVPNPTKVTDMVGYESLPKYIAEGFEQARNSDFIVDTKDEKEGD